MLISSWQIIELSFKFWLKNFKKLLPYLALMFVPTLILATLQYLTVFITTYAPNLGFAAILFVFAVGVAGVVLNIWVAIAMARAIKSMWREEVGHWKDVFLGSSHLIWPSIVINIILVAIMLAVIAVCSGVGIITHLLASSLPGPVVVALFAVLAIILLLVFGVMLAFAFYEVIFESSRNFSAVKASFHLVSKRWWSVFIRLFIPNLVFLLMMLVVQKIVTIPLWWLEDKTIMIVLPIVNSVLGLLMSPLSTAAIILLYQNLKDNPVSATQSLPPTLNS